MTPPIVMTIAGSDSGSGAGVQADLKTFSALGTYGASVVTALTAQNTHSILEIAGLTPSFVQAQLKAIASDMDIKATKIGMVHTAEIIQIVAEGIREFHLHPLVLDPIMVATTGDSLIQLGAMRSLKEYLFPLSTLITPNLPEAALLVEEPLAQTEEEMICQGQKLLTFGPEAVLIKGGHRIDTPEESVDIFINKKGVTRYTAQRIHTNNVHGTGCTLSAAIVAGLAWDLPLSEAIGAAKAYVTAALENSKSWQIGRGRGPLVHSQQYFGKGGKSPATIWQEILHQK